VFYPLHSEPEGLIQIDAVLADHAFSADCFCVAVVLLAAGAHDARQAGQQVSFTLQQYALAGLFLAVRVLSLSFFYCRCA
jgi:hypothetical protein